MNIAALLIFGKIVAWILLVFSAFCIYSTISSVVEHNNDSLKVAVHGQASAKVGYIGFFVVMILLSAGFLVGSCGV